MKKKKNTKKGRRNAWDYFFLKTEKKQSIINNNICLYICMNVKDQLSEP